MANSQSCFLKLGCAGAGVSFFTPCTDVFNYFLSGGGIIREVFPAYHSRHILNSDEINSEYPDYRISYFDLPDRNLFVDPLRGNVSLICPYEELYLSDIVFLIQGVLARRLAAGGKYLLHASCVDKVGKGACIITEPGLGKTAVALDCCLEFGCSFVGDDRLVVGIEDGTPVVMAGTKRIKASPNAFSRYPSAVKNGFVNDTHEVQDSWEKSLYLDEIMSQGAIQCRDFSELAVIAVVCTDGAKDSELVVHRIDTESVQGRFDAQLLLFDFFSNIIRTHEKICHSVGLAIPSFDDPELAEQRLRILNYIIGTVKVLEIRGQVSAVAKVIAEELE